MSDSEAMLKDVRTASWQTFRAHVHIMLLAGYRLAKSSIGISDPEEDISGALVKHIKHYQDDPEAPEWGAHYSAQNEVPELWGTRKGKQHQRKDVVFEWCSLRPRLYYVFEAKRLCTGFTESKYFKEGLLRFVREEYARDNPEAAMLGYVQEHTIADWNQRLQQWATRHAHDLGHQSSCILYPAIAEFPDEISMQSCTV